VAMTAHQTFVAFTALLAVAACSPRSEPAAPRKTETAPVEAEGVSRFKIGALDASALLDGTITVPNDGKTFGVGRPTSEVAAVLKAAGVREDQLELSIQPLLVRSGDRVLLFDTGAGDVAFAKGGRLQASLQAAGLKPDQVTDIFISHGHPDHVGGLLSPSGTLALPNAAIRLAAPEWEAMKANPAQAAIVAAITPKVATFEPGAGVLPGLVTAVPVNGHTPGHSAYEVVSGAERLLYIGDTAHHFVVSVQRPDWTIDYDVDAPMAEKSRRALLQRAADQNLRLHAVHFPYPGLGRVKRQGEGFVWIPE
jgi:glyoxylase-like metal-dependent hydrolase (beta-lactamase superfamily II)